MQNPPNDKDFLQMRNRLPIETAFLFYVSTESNYSGDLNSELVWYSNGQKQFAP